MSYVDYCRKHGDFKGDYCGECIDELYAENARLREALIFRGYNPDDELKFHEEEQKDCAALEGE